MPTELSEDTRVLSRLRCAEIIHRILNLTEGGGITTVFLLSWWNGEVRWARNELSSLSDRTDVKLLIHRKIRDGHGSAVLNQLDDVSMEAAVRLAEVGAASSSKPTIGDLYLNAPPLQSPETVTWSNSTVEKTADSRSLIVEEVIAKARNGGMLSAGYLEVRAGSSVLFSIANEQRTLFPTPEIIERNMPYSRYSQAQCSTTIRHPKGTGSGWAGGSSFDWDRIDSAQIANRALEKCLQSLNPVRIEPGRYTVILEPQAVSDLLDILFWRYRGISPMKRYHTEDGFGPFVLKSDPPLKPIRTKLGLRIIDERITIGHDPMDPELGVLTEPGLAPVTWIKNGVLLALDYEHDYAAVKLNEDSPMLFRPSYRMSGGTTSMNEMIASTQRGILVTRLSQPMLVDDTTLLTSGSTRDGLWLIEGGAITKAVNNMRFMDSPLFVLNNVDQLGIPVPVFRPESNPFMPALTPAVIPPIKANDFCFTGTLDAI